MAIVASQASRNRVKRECVPLDFRLMATTLGQRKSAVKAYRIGPA
jgi:hypothetical protein